MSPTTSTPKRTRRIAATLTGITALSVVPFATASARTLDPPAPTSVDALCMHVPDGYDPFDDVAEGDTFADEIRCLRSAGITEGSGHRVYDPLGTVTRDQMASFLVRMADVAVELDTSGELQELPSHDGMSMFDDIVEDAEHAEAVHRLAHAGIALGGPGGLPDSSFAPALQVSREQMASFVARTLEHLSGAPLPAADDYFSDDDTSVHEANINALAEAGINVGDDSGTYRPGAWVTREQMSAYLMRSLATYEQAGGIGPLPPPAPEPKPYTATLPVDLSGTPGVTPEQQAEAERVVTETLVKLPKYADPQVAIDEGYTSIGDGFTGEEHYMKKSLFNDGRILDPEYPESLVYDTTGPTKTLISAMYFLPDGITLDDAPRFGGPLTQWHVHEDLCFSNPDAPVLGDIPGVHSPCPSGQFKILNPMIHVWVVPHPCGPFAALDGLAGGQVPDGEERLCDHDHGHGHPDEHGHPGGH